MVNIISNGSHWAGEEESPLSDLFKALRAETLDPAFEQYGNFIILPEGASKEVRFWGNFLTVSHVFSIDTDEPGVIKSLTEAIRSNQQSEKYQAAKMSMTRAREANHVA